MKKGKGFVFGAKIGRERKGGEMWKTKGSEKSKGKRTVSTLARWRNKIRAADAKYGRSNTGFSKLKLIDGATGRPAATGVFSRGNIVIAGFQLYTISARSETGGGALCKR